MRKQSAKNQLRELVTGIKAPERKVIFINEGEELDPETCDEKAKMLKSLGLSIFVKNPER